MSSKPGLKIAKEWLIRGLGLGLIIWGGVWIFKVRQEPGASQETSLSSPTGAPQARSRPTPQPIKPVKSMKDLQEHYGGNWTQVPSRLGEKPALSGEVALGELNSKTVGEFGRSLAGLYGLQPEELAGRARMNSPQPLTSAQREHATANFSVQQLYQGYPVINSSLRMVGDLNSGEILYVDGAELKNFSGQRLPEPKPISAIKPLVQKHLKTGGRFADTNLQVLEKDGRPHLVYTLIDIPSGQVPGPDSKTHFVDASSGAILSSVPMVEIF